MNREGLGKLLQSARLALQAAHGSEYEQQNLADRLGEPKSNLSPLENGGRASFPDPDLVKKLTQGYHVTLQQMLEAAGYQLDEDVVSIISLQQILAKADSLEVLSLLYNIDRADAEAVDRVAKRINKQPKTPRRGRKKELHCSH